MSAVIDILNELRARGVRIEPRPHGGVRLVPARLIDAELLNRILNHKAEVLTQFRAEQEERRIDGLATMDGWKPLALAGAPAYSILETCRRHGIAVSLDEDGCLRIGKADGSGQEPTLWPSLEIAIEAHLEAVTALVTAGWYLRADVANVYGI
jgi:hypothetical protein